MNRRLIEEEEKKGDGGGGPAEPQENGRIANEGGDNLNSYKRGMFIHQGEFSQIFEAERKADGAKFVIKEFKREKNNSAQINFQRKMHT